MAPTGATPTAAATAVQSVGNYASAVAGNYVFLALSFATTVFLARSLGADGFGHLTLVFTIAQTALHATAIWTESAFLRYGAEELETEGRLAEVLWGRILLMTPSIVLAAGVGWLLERWIEAFHGADVGYGLLVAYFVTLELGQLLRGIYQARSRAGAFAFFQAAERAATLGALLTLQLTFGLTLARILFVYVAAALAAFLAASRLLPRHDFLPVETSRRTVRRLFVFSAPMILSVFGTYLTSNWLDVAVIRHYLDSAAVAHYALAYQLMGAVQQIPFVSFSVVVPVLVGAHVAHRPDAIRLYLDRVVPHAVCAMSAVLIVAVLGVPPLVRLIFGEAFVESARAVPVLLFAVGWYCILIAYVPILILHERTWSILMATLAAAVVNLLGDLLLVRIAGVVGVAWATVLSQITYAIIFIRVARLDYRFSPGVVLAMLGPLAIALAGAQAKSPLVVVATGVVALIVLVVIARTQHLGSPDDRKLLASLNVPGLRRLLPTASAPEIS